MTRVVLILFGAAFASFFARPSLANTDDRDLAAGRRLFSKGDWAGAAKALLLVAPRLSDPQKRALAYRQLGLAQLELSQTIAAEESFALALAADPLTELNPAQDSPAAVARFRAVRARLDGTFTVTTDQPARIAIDGADRGVAPLTLKLPIGPHHVRATSPDARYAAERSNVVIFSGKKMAVQLELKPLVAFLDVTGPAGFAIAIDGVTVGQTPAMNIAVTPGKHVLTVSAAGFDPKVTPIEVQAGDRRVLDGSLRKPIVIAHGPPPRRPPRLTRPWGWLAAGVAVVAAGVGITLYAVTDPLADHDSSRRNTGIGFMVGGAVSGVASAVLFILHRDR
ncbi:MAG: PEGA domain-containing protein [Deltaproteobacteria bacterium]|nr:PEGA domain-containing protein [Deltaproteobacteria bacterium]